MCWPGAWAVIIALVLQLSFLTGHVTIAVGKDWFSHWRICDLIFFSRIYLSSLSRPLAIKFITGSVTWSL